MSVPQPSSFSSLPPLPQPIRVGVGAQVGDTLYVGLGCAGAAWYALNLQDAQPQWHRLADFPGVAREQALALVHEGQVWVMGGAGQAQAGAPTQALADMHRFDPASNTWQAMPSAPRGLLGTTACVLPSGPMAFFGGVNPDVFKAYTSLMQRTTGREDAQAALTRQYLAQPCEAYRFPSGVIGFDPQHGHWLDLGEGPVPGRAGSAIAVRGDTMTLISGEAKPGLRCTDVWQIRDDGDTLDWHAVSAPGEAKAAGFDPEGYAGAVAGYADDTLLLLGGTHFPGARARYNAGHYYAHEGLTKTWTDGILALHGQRWQRVGQLPRPTAHAVVFERPDGLLLVGGETTSGVALDQVVFVRRDPVSGDVTCHEAH